MRIVEGFCVRHVLNEIIAVPTGKAAQQISGLISLNEVGEFLFHLLQTEQTLDTLASAITDEYDVTYEQAFKDAEEFIDIFQQVGLLIGTPSSTDQGKKDDL